MCEKPRRDERECVPFDDGEDVGNPEVRRPVLFELRDADCSVGDVHVGVEDLGRKVACTEGEDGIMREWGKPYMREARLGSLPRIQT